MPATKPVGSGRRDRRITIQQRPDADAQAPSQYPVDTWTDVACVMAAKTEIRGAKRFNDLASQDTAPYDTQWEIPYLACMDPELVAVTKLRRLVVRGRVHDIVAAYEIGRKRAIEVMTIAGGLVV